MYEMILGKSEITRKRRTFRLSSFFLYVYDIIKNAIFEHRNATVFPTIFHFFFFFGERLKYVF